MGRLTQSAVWTAAFAVALVVLAAPGAARADGLERLKDYLERLDAVFDHCHYKLTIQSEYFGAPGGQDPSAVRYFEWRVQQPNLRMSQLETFYHWDGSWAGRGEVEVLKENDTTHSASPPWQHIQSISDPGGLLGAAALGVPMHWGLREKLRDDVSSFVAYYHLYKFEESKTPSGDIIVKATRLRPMKGHSDLVLRLTIEAASGRIRSIETFSSSADVPASRVTVEEYLELPGGDFPIRLVWETFDWSTNQMKDRHTFVAHDVSLGADAPAGTFTFPQFAEDLDAKTSPTRTAFYIVRYEVTRSGGQVMTTGTSAGMYRDGKYHETFNAAAARAAALAARPPSDHFLDGVRLSMKWSLPLLGGVALVLLLLPKVFRRARKWERE